MLRSAAAMAAALAVPRLLGDPLLLVPLALGGLYASANDLDGAPAHRHASAGRSLHVLLPAMAGALGLTVGIELHNTPALVALGGTALVAAAAGALGALGPTGSAAALQLLAMAAVAQGLPLPALWWVPGAAVLGGASLVVLLGPSSPERSVTWPSLEEARSRIGRRATAVRVVRLVVAAEMASALALVWRPERAYWLLLTVALVLAPDAGPVWRRVWHRGVGTVVGVGAAAGLVLLRPGPPHLVAAVLAAEVVVPLAASTSYGMLTTTVAPVVVALLGLSGVALTPDLLGARLADTAAGLALCLAVTLPGRSAVRLSRRRTTPTGC